MPQSMLKLYARLTSIAISFFVYDAFWSATWILKTLYVSRFVLLTMPLIALFTLAQVIYIWPRTGDDAYYLSIREADRRYEEVRGSISELRDQIHLTQSQVLANSDISMGREIRLSRMEDKFDLLSKIIGAVCLVLITQSLTYVVNLRIHREALKYRSNPPHALKD